MADPDENIKKGYLVYEGEKKNLSDVSRNFVPPGKPEVDWSTDQETKTHECLIGLANLVLIR